MSADTSELRAYAYHLDTAVASCENELSELVEKGAQSVQRAAQSRLRSWSRGRYLKHYRRSFSYEMDGPLEAEVGPDASKPQGRMGRGVEFGSVHTAPAPHWLPAADEVEPRFASQAAGILARSLK